MSGGDVIVSLTVSKTADDGQVGVQTPQPMQRAGSAAAFSSSPRAIASIGHLFPHVPQPMHASRSTEATYVDEDIILMLSAFWLWRNTQQHPQQLQTIDR